MITPDEASDFLLIKCRDMGECLTNMKLQKMLYYAQAWALVSFDNEPLFEEDFQAWVHGPVLVSQFNRFKDSVWKPILDEDITLPTLDSDVEKHLKEIIEVFGVESAVSLDLMVHKELPYLTARKGYHMAEVCHEIISKESMYKYYNSL